MHFTADEHRSLRTLRHTSPYYHNGHGRNLQQDDNHGNAVCREKALNLVSETVKAIGANYLYGGHDCLQFYDNIQSVEEKQNCVCKDELHTFFTHSGSNCRCW